MLLISSITFLLFTAMLAAKVAATSISVYSEFLEHQDMPLMTRSVLINGPPNKTDIVATWTSDLLVRFITLNGLSLLNPHI